MTVYSYSKAQQNLALLLEQAYRDGFVQIKRQDGILFRVAPVKTTSPFDIEGIDVNISANEIVECIRESRECRNYG
ncbi:hypothetical protein [Candidatus Parabeggiatoa sp. HSG14]|uniref:hypothetical protein n=1 Tax=Candidatus Parabeggiatoa sp. HSG14 TaxID=3055593 RepID=UPI0025A74C7B|nr:hypothetical protein [Thiotrichales bacterium HSG14]